MMTFESQAECTDQADKEYEHGCVIPESEAIMY
jgi:hypothetical protein